MTGPGDERPPSGRPDPAVPSPPGQYPHDQPPYAQQPPEPQYGQQYGQSPYGGPAADPTEPPYIYNPYGNFPYPSSYPSPAGLGGDTALPPKRPGSMHLALLLIVVSALPFLLVGLVAVLGAGQAATALPPEDLAQLQQVGVDVVQVLSLIHI